MAYELGWGFKDPFGTSRGTWNFSLISMSLQLRDQLTRLLVAFRIPDMQLPWMPIAARMAATVLVANVCEPASEQVVGTKRVSRRVPHKSLKHILLGPT